jgi:hypothetical protein
MKNDVSLISGTLRPMMFMNYQIVISYRDETKIFKSFNILNGSRILRKYYLPNPIPIDENLNIEEIIIARLMEELNFSQETTTKPSKKNQKSTKRKVDENARKEAAKSLFTDLGL